MLTREAKQEIIQQLNNKFKSYSSIFVLDYKGLNVKELEKIRKDLRVVDSELKIVKNTLLKKASDSTLADQLCDLFVGTTAVGFSKGDFSQSAKIFIKSAKDNEQFAIKGGMIEGKKVSLNEIEQISKLPSKDELIVQLAVLLNSPMSRFLYSLQNMQTKILYALKALEDKKQKQQK